ncbi:MAG: hypothetical protein IK116_06580 [Firmicutes bacterium]|nr:hypothetical protein [Bacillota bacterium]
MKKTVILALLLLTLALLLTACGGAAEESSTGILNVQRDDELITADIVFADSCDNVSVVFHCDVDNDSFSGAAEYVYELGAVEPEQTYTVEADATGNGWGYSGIFKNISSSSLSSGLNMPSLAEETIVITVLDGETELFSTESTR